MATTTRTLDDRASMTTDATTAGDDHALGDLAHEVMFKALDMAENAEMAARAMLLGVATLIHDDPTFGRSIPISTALLAAMRTELDTLAAGASGVTGSSDTTH